MISKRSFSTVDDRGDGGADAAWLVHVRRPTMQVYRRRDIFGNMVLLPLQGYASRINSEVNTWHVAEVTSTHDLRPTLE